jgi:prevent-host-death family protein
VRVALCCGFKSLPTRPPCKLVTRSGAGRRAAAKEQAKLASAVFAGPAWLHAGAGGVPPVSHCLDMRAHWAPRGICVQYGFPVLHVKVKMAEADETVTVTAAEFHRNVGVYQDIALTKPVMITKNGRERTVLLSAQEYARLKRRDRRVIAAGDLSERQIEAIRKAQVPESFTDLDDELES